MQIDEVSHENLTSMVLSVNTNDDNAKMESKSQRRPKRTLHFPDGVMEEYSSEDESDNATEQQAMPVVDPKTLNWLPWTWHLTTQAGTKVLNTCDYLGEHLAWFFGITSPKYAFEINEFHRLQALQNEIIREEDLELGGWNERKNNLINHIEVPVAKNQTPTNL